MKPATAPKRPRGKRNKTVTEAVRLAGRIRDNLWRASQSGVTVRVKALEVLTEGFTFSDLTPRAAARAIVRETRRVFRRTG